jgi:hypothetical protein
VIDGSVPRGADPPYSVNRAVRPLPSVGTGDRSGDEAATGHPARAPVDAGVTIETSGAQGVQIGNWNVQHVNLSQTQIVYGSPSVDPIVYHFLRTSFLDVIPRSPYLFECREVRAGRGIPHRHTRRWHAVHVVAHITEDEAVMMPLSPADFRAWLDLVEQQPVFLLHCALRRSGFMRMRMLCLHDWLLHDATSQPGWGNMSNLPLRAFRSIGKHDALFHRAVIQEVDRATGAEGAMWRTLKDVGLVPVDEMTLLEFMELARFLEMPRAILTRLAALGSPTEVVTDCIRTGLAAHDPVIDSWLSTVRELSRLEPAGFERRQFRRFVRFLEGRGQAIHLPRYTGREVGYWRIFTGKYPDVLDGLKHIIQTSDVGNDIAFAASLLPTLALANDRVISSRASSVLRNLSDRKQDFPDYYVRREILRSMVEGGERSWLPESVQLIVAGGRTGEEQRYLNSYGWPADLVKVNIERKLISPTLRDEQMREVIEVMGDVIDQNRK